MMGHGHAVMGAAGWVALAGTGAGALGIVPMEPAHVAAGALVTAGAALLPDVDHHNGSIAHSLPPISNVITRIVGPATGGHRHGTHSLLGVLIFFGLAWALAPLRIDLPGGIHDDFQVGAWAIIVLMVSFALKALRLVRGKVSAWTLAVGFGTAATWFAPEQLWWLPLSVGLGAFIHVLGDGLTTQGVPWLWPLNPKPPVETTLWRKNGYFALPLLGNAGSTREWIFVTALYGYTAFVIARQFGLL